MSLYQMELQILEQSRLWNKIEAVSLEDGCIEQRFLQQIFDESSRLAMLLCCYAAMLLCCYAAMLLCCYAAMLLCCFAERHYGS